MQAIMHDKAKWHAMMQGAGSTQEVLALKDSRSGRMADSLGAEYGHFLPYHLVDFWINLSLCHALLVDTSEGEPKYQVCLLLPAAPSVLRGAREIWQRSQQLQPSRRSRRARAALSQCSRAATAAEVPLPAAQRACFTPGCCVRLRRC
jgi:hypothetical protein